MRKKWGANLLAINWKYILKIWRQRCEDVHGVTKTDMDRLKKEKLLKEIEHIQSTNKELLTKKTEWIHEDIEELAKLDNSALEAWLYGANVVSKINKKKMKQRAEINKENGIIRNMYGRKIKGKSDDKSELDPGEHDAGE